MLIFGQFLQIPSIFAAETPGDGDSTRTLNNGQLILQDIPAIPDSLVNRLNQFQNVRSANFVDWTEDGNGLYVLTRFSQVNQIHRVDFPGGARHQLTFFTESIGQVTRQNQGARLAFTMDVGGSEFSQIFLLDPESAATRMISDGSSRNSQLVWDQHGAQLAYQSTRRNGRSNDIWLMDIANDESARPVLEAQDDHWWGPADFTADGKFMLVQQYVGATDSRVYLLDLTSGEQRRLSGDPDQPSANRAVVMDRNSAGFYLISNARGAGAELAWQSLQAGVEAEYITTSIAWDVTEFALSEDGRRGAFTTNEDGISRLYLLNTRTKHFSLVGNMPVGLISDMRFHPDNRRLALTLSTAQTPSDVFVMQLGKSAEDVKSLQR